MHREVLAQIDGGSSAVTLGNHAETNSDVLSDAQRMWATRKDQFRAPPLRKERGGADEAVTSDAGANPSDGFECHPPEGKGCNCSYQPLSRGVLYLATGEIGRTCSAT